MHRAAGDIEQQQKVSRESKLQNRLTLGPTPERGLA